MGKLKLNDEDSTNRVVTNNAHIRYIRKQPMELINEYTGLMQCKVCGQQHLADMKPNSNGRFYRGAWQCPNGCKI
jgi:hypothetical protein